jgi:hypothetical protein
VRSAVALHQLLAGAIVIVGIAAAFLLAGILTHRPGRGFGALRVAAFVAAVIAALALGLALL